jgi:hypothetical protein
MTREDLLKEAILVKSLLKVYPRSDSTPSSCEYFLYLRDGLDKISPNHPLLNTDDYVGMEEYWNSHYDAITQLIGIVGVLQP